MRSKTCIIVALFLLFGSLSVAKLIWSTYINKVNKSGHSETSGWFAKHFSLDYYWRADNYINEIFDKISLYFTFTPFYSGIYKTRLLFIFNLSPSNCWLEDWKTGQRYPAYYTDRQQNDSYSMRVKEYDDKNKRFLLYNKSEQIRFCLDFELLPPEVREVDVYINNTSWFSKVKINPARDLKK